LACDRGHCCRLFAIAIVGQAGQLHNTTRQHSTHLGVVAFGLTRVSLAGWLAGWVGPTTAPGHSLLCMEPRLLFAVLPSSPPRPATPDDQRDQTPTHHAIARQAPQQTRTDTVSVRFQVSCAKKISEECFFFQSFKPFTLAMVVTPQLAVPRKFREPTRHIGGGHTQVLSTSVC
jgi:hypothetical protein